MGPCITLDTRYGVKVRAPASLDCVTTYVLLEQEGWFEREIDFLARMLQPGDIVIDVGANHGVYSLPMALAVGPSGRVIAFEPAGETRSRLEESARLNGFSHLEIVGAALSDREGEAVLHLGGGGGELNTLAGPIDGAQGAETVTLARLDDEARRLGLGAPVFIKIDAEGEELRVVEGGRELLIGAQPALMFEIRNGADNNLDLAARIAELGFGIYRLLGDASLLAPWSEDSHDPWDLNLFAVPAGRAEDLERRGLLVREAAAPVRRDLRWIADLPGVRAFTGAAPVAPELQDALGLYSGWRDLDLPPAVRLASLEASFEVVQALCRQAATPGRLSTLVRIAADLGRRGEALMAIDALMGMRRAPAGELFLPASSLAEDQDVAGKPLDWFAASVLEQGERLGRYSSRFSAADPALLTGLALSPFASGMPARRLALQLTREGQSWPTGLEDRLARETRNSSLLTPPALASLAYNTAPL